MTKRAENINLYSVRVADHGSVSTIEAPNDEQARRAAAATYGTNVVESKCEIESKEPVFEASVGLECPEGASESDVFEIKVRGVDEKKVAELAEAIHVLIGGPGVPDGLMRSAAPFRAAVDGVMAIM